jgi:hypothetical protein
MNSAEETVKNGAAPNAELDPARGRQHFPRERADEVDVLRVYARILLQWPKTIMISVLLVAGITGIVSKFFLTKWYKATAVIRPVSDFAVEEQLQGLMSGFASGGGGGTGGMGLLSGLTGGGTDADEYVGILKSFTFAHSIIRRHKLMDDLLPSDKPSLAEFETSRHLQWLAYRNMHGRFICDYSIKTGNITVEFEDLDPARAETVMRYIIDDFRELLRQKQLHDVKSAVASLNEEAAHTSDTMLQTVLYQLIANQIQREKTAEVEADFAFTVIEAPAASDIKVWPPTTLFCLLAALGTFTMVATYILFIHPSPLGPRVPLLPDKAQESLEGERSKRPAIPNAAQRPVP